MFSLYDFQREAVKAIFSFFSKNQFGIFYVKSPTGTGKTIICLDTVQKIRQMSPNAKVYVVTPRVEIVVGFLKGLGYKTADKASEKKLKKIAEKEGVFTFKSFVSKSKSGKLPPPDVLIIDECHRVLEGKTESDTMLYFKDCMRVIGFTATDHRGTPRETAQWRKLWPNSHVTMTPKEAVNRGYWRDDINYKIVGCMNDDVLKFQKGQFVIKKMSDVEECAGDSFFDTILKILIKESPAHVVKYIAVPSVEIANATRDFLRNNDFPCESITHTTKNRSELFAKFRSGEIILVGVNVMTEGVDFPELALFIDARPTMSPNIFMQAHGRLTRLIDKSLVPSKTYYCLNRNIERFAYLLEGVIPPSKVKETQELYGGASKRNGKRIFGEAFGNFKPLSFKAKSGYYGSFYLIYANCPITRNRTKYAAILLPHKEQPILCRSEWIRKENPSDPNKPWDFDNPKCKWQRVHEVPEDFTGYATETLKSKVLSRKQKETWDRFHSKVGLANRRVDPREFEILFILNQSNVRLT